MILPSDSFARGLGDGAERQEPVGDVPARPWAYSAFPVEIREITRLSPQFLRFTLAGSTLRHFAPWGVDQRIKLVLPIPGDAAADFRLAEFGLLADPTPHPSDWYQRWRQLPEEQRNVLRTYTPSAIRPEAGEIDVDVFLHQPAGPASAWALAAVPGDRLVLTGPDVRNGWTGYGIHWHPGQRTRLLIVADETAYPAARNILRSLPKHAETDLIIEVNDPADELLSRDAPQGTRITVVARGGDAPSGAEDAVRVWGEQQSAAGREPDDLYVWVAGESGETTRIRRLLVQQIGVPKEQIAFLGYWRTGGPLVG